MAGLVDKYKEVEFYGPLNRVAIVFYPGGINHFLEVPLSNYLEKHFSEFQAFGAPFKECLDAVYATENLKIKRDLLDAFLIERYQPFKEIEILKAIDYLVNSSVPMKVTELSNQLVVSRRTLLRKFKKHLGYSIEEYTSVIKFRKALLSFQKKQEVKDLSKIALESNYYDQPDFNHQIKSRSNLTPKQLFEQLEIVVDILFWKL